MEYPIRYNFPYNGRKLNAVASGTGGGDQVRFGWIDGADEGPMVRGDWIKACATSTETSARQFRNTLKKQLRQLDFRFLLALVAVVVGILRNRRADLVDFSNQFVSLLMTKLRPAPSPFTRSITLGIL